MTSVLAASVLGQARRFRQQPILKELRGWRCEPGVQFKKEVPMKRLANVFVMVALAAGLLQAHHGWTGYDETKLVQHTGMIKETGYENPHGFVKIEADKKIWNVILAPPSRMESRGLPKDKLKVGAMVTIAGYQHKQAKEEIRAERITIDGKTVELR
jgi:hypothetical protein